ESPLSRSGTATAIPAAETESRELDSLVQIIAQHPTMKPIPRLPESPRKTEAGVKLYRRNPSRAPASGSVVRANPRLWSITAPVNNAAVEHSASPPASPSTPSIRLNALLHATSQRTVSGADQSVSTAVPEMASIRTPAR